MRVRKSCWWCILFVFSERPDELLNLDTKKQPLASKYVVVMQKWGNQVALHHCPVLRFFQFALSDYLLKVKGQEECLDWFLITTFYSRRSGHSKWGYHLPSQLMFTSSSEGLCQIPLRWIKQGEAHRCSVWDARIKEADSTAGWHRDQEVLFPLCVLIYFFFPGTHVFLNVFMYSSMKTQCQRDSTVGRHCTISLTHGWLRLIPRIT